MLRSTAPRILVAILCAAALVSSPTAASSGDARATLERIDSSTLDLEAATRVRKLRLEAGLATLMIEDARLFPAGAVDGRPVEFVLLGDAVFELAPPDRIESDQLERFTASSSLHEPISAALLVICRDSAADALVARERLADPDPAEWARAQELYESWKSGPERKILSARSAMMRDALGDTEYDGYFAGRFESERLGTFLYLVDPDAAEQVTLGQFVRQELTEKETRQGRKDVHRLQRQGRLLGLELEDLGTFDSWVSTSLKDAAGSPAPGNAPFEPRHYTLDVRTDGKRERIDGTAELHLRATMGGRRFVPLRMGPDLQIERVTDPAGTELPFVQERADAYVVLAEAPAADAETVVRVTYGGNALVKVSGDQKLFTLSDTLGWYPHAGDLDRATYDLTLRWPKRLDLVASGQLVEQGEDADESFMRRRLDVPSPGVSFELGQFEVEKFRVGNVAVSVAYDRLSSIAHEDVRTEVQETVRDALEYYQEVFGPYPLEYLQLTTSPREFSQGLLGFVTLSLLHMQDDELLSPLSGLDDRRMILAHELAHQWWGGVVGWNTYRDQWLSEALANYSALLWARNRVPPELRPRQSLISDWKSILTYTTDTGRSIEQMGPMVLGGRLEASDSEGAYQAVVYQKGAVVLNMLSQNWEEAQFLEGLRRLCEAFRFLSISTEDFFRAVSKLFGTEMDWFAEQFVYGTGLPEVYYDYDFDRRDDGKWSVKTRLQQQTPYRYLDRVVRLDDGRLDVRRVATREIDTSSFKIVVPVAIGFHSDDPAQTGKKRQSKDRGELNQWLLGRIRLEGASEEFEIPVDFEPLDFALDRHEIVFARFFNETREPKRTTFYRGLDALNEGDLAGAETLFRQSLDAVLYGAESDPGTTRAESKSEQEALDYRIRLRLAELLLDAGRLEDAGQALREAAKSDASASRGQREPWLRILEARLSLLRGETAQAFKALQHLVVRKEVVDTTEAYLLLAIAAQAVGDSPARDDAIEVARARGADLGPLGE